MELKAQQSNGVVVIAFEQPGELTASEAPAFQTAVEALIQDSKQVVLDLSQIQFIDSSGLGTLVSLNRKLIRDGGELRLAGITRPVATVFELTRLHRFFEIYDTVEEAVASFESGFESE